MYYCLVHYPDIDIEKIQGIRKKYDPTFRLINPHITLVFPTPNIVNEPQLIKHIREVLGSWRIFNIHLSGFRKSWDNWLFLNVAEGASEISKLHAELYTGMLRPFLREDIPFTPHVSLGLFTIDAYNLKDPKQAKFDEDGYKKALTEAEGLNMNYISKLNKLTLIKLDNNLAKIIESESFPLLS